MSIMFGKLWFVLTTCCQDLWVKFETDGDLLERRFLFFLVQTEVREGLGKNCAFYIVA